MLDEGRRLGRHHRSDVQGAVRARGHGHLVELGKRKVDRCVVPIQHRRAALRIRALDRGLDGGDRLVLRKDAREREVAGLEHCVDSARQARVASDPAGVDHVEAQALVDDLGLHLDRDPAPDLVRPEGAVEQERPAIGRTAQDIHLFEEAELVAADEAGLLDQVRRVDRAGTEPEVGDGHRSRLLGVEDEVALCEEVGLLADDFHGVAGSAHGAVRAQAIEHRGGDVRGFGSEARVDLEAQVGDVVDDPHRELTSWCGGGQLFEHRGRHGGRELLGREAVPTADDERRLGSRSQGDDDVLEQGLARCTRLLRAVEHGDPAHARREGGGKGGGGERPKQVHLQEPDPLAAREQGFHCFLRGPDA